MKLPESLKLITDTLWRIETPEDFSGIFEDILTPAEITDMADRITILQMLKAGKSQRDIAETLGVSITTVSRGNRVLQYGKGNIDKYLLS
ncbi:MAG: YerC/YecD family TrpR-related protein [Candidatus Gracilibacteria bacterium]|nr:YerC/YecD family TrpR-related protein [Candidatus Gracilibacteria bacterium]